MSADRATGESAVKKLDCAFCLSAYDAGQVLESLAQQARNAVGRRELSTLLEEKINETLHPTSVAVYLEDCRREPRLQHGDWVASEPFPCAAKPWFRELYGGRSRT